MAKGRLIAKGRTAEVFEWGDGQVLKLLYDWCPVDWAQQEEKKTSMVNAMGLPSPRCLGTVVVDGRRGVLFERIAGPSLLRLMLVKPWMLGRGSRIMAEIHAAINGKTAPELPPLRGYLERCIEADARLDAETKAGLSGLLAGLPDGENLCHFDIHPDQIVMSPKGPIVLDWMAAFKGDPAADAARTLVLMRLGKAPGIGWMMGLLIDAVRSFIARVYTRRYLQLRKDTDRERMRKWMIVIAAARLREGISGEGEAILDFVAKGLRSAGS